MKDTSIRLRSTVARKAATISRLSKRRGIAMSTNAIVNMAVELGLPAVRQKLLSPVK